MDKIQSPIQFVVLAGGTGSRFDTLSSDIPKPFLPVANKPLLQYVFEFLCKSNVPKALVVTHSGLQQRINKIAEKLSIEIEIITVNPDLGTADVLREIASKIDRDFVVISGDLITNVPLHEIADIHRVSGSAMVMLLNEENEENSKKIRKDKLVSKHFIGLDNDRVAMFLSSFDSGKSVKLRKPFLEKCSEFELYSNMTDGHLYFFKHWVLRLIEKKKKSISSIQGDLVPLLVKAQFNPKIAKRLSKYSQEGQYPNFKGFSSLEEEGEVDNRKFNIKCIAYKTPRDLLCMRVNTLNSYLRANFTLINGNPFFSREAYRYKTVYIHKGFRIHEDDKIENSLLGKELTISGTKNVINSVIGENCTIGENVKIENSIIMNNVKIQNGCQIINTVIMNSAILEENCRLTQCTVRINQTVEKDTNTKNYIFGEESFY
ncbi:translation initiation factor eif-2b subunit gamma [Anaeramoeba flamelloides]|uniref:Translation initiation factor eIF2B subunit gamma n=1 Tax=Anaeramoeba flamelloides TaxID=1746091 RepID=A0ABQ8ZCX2_9EUKA|nr:translation initiation factor eif-2b subunit gamma [Anaeramoeba flamelloides]